MSFDKNAVESDVIDHLMRLATHLGVSALLEGRGIVQGYDCTGSREIRLRRLEIQGLVFLERMERTDDCDTNDVVCVHCFKPGEEPSGFPLEVDERVVAAEAEARKPPDLLARIREALGGHRGHLGADELIEEIKEHQHLVVASLFGDIHDTYTCGVCARQRANEQRDGAPRKPVRTGP